MFAIALGVALLTLGLTLMVWSIYEILSTKPRYRRKG